MLGYKTAMSEYYKFIQGRNPLQDMGRLGNLGQQQTNPYYAYSRDCLNTNAFLPGELDKLREIDKRIDECRVRRKAAILKAFKLSI